MVFEWIAAAIRLTKEKHSMDVDWRIKLFRFYFSITDYGSNFALE
jgi:hypothetical protein